LIERPLPSPTFPVASAKVKFQGQRIFSASKSSRSDPRSCPGEDAARDQSHCRPGTVKWFNDAKGFGSIEPEGGGEDVFAHLSAIQMEGFRTHKQGSRVSYELFDGPKGELAQEILPVDGPMTIEPSTLEATAATAH
jgi:CspA family cold shock protein